MSDLFDRARDACRLEDLAGKLVKLRGRGDELRGPCPICAASAKSGTVFKVEVGAQRWRCFACERHGDVVDLHHYTTGMSLAEAARDLAGPEPAAGVARQAIERPIADDGGKADRTLRLAADMVSASRPILGTLGDFYLLGRGIIPEVVERLDAPMFHPECPHSWNPDARVWRRAPAIVCRIVTPGGWTGGVHCTYLDPDGGKTALTPGKLMWGPQGEENGVGRRRGGSWLIGGFRESGDLVIGEGLESSLGLASHLWLSGLRDFGVVAALSLGALQGGLARDDEGCVDLVAPKPNAASPAFTWPPCYTAPGNPVPRAHISIDRDMSPIKVKARTPRGRIVTYELDAEARARLCANLAKQAWRAAGWSAVSYKPAHNSDWADMAKDRHV